MKGGYTGFETFEDADKNIADRQFPGITQYGCRDPWTDFEDSNSQFFFKCDKCPRRYKCQEDIKHISKALDNYGKTDRKKRRTIKKIKRKRCKCK